MYSEKLQELQELQELQNKNRIHGSGLCFRARSVFRGVRLRARFRFYSVTPATPELLQLLRHNVIRERDIFNWKTAK